MKLENLTHHQYFCESVKTIINSLGDHFSYSEIEQKVLDDEYMCYFPKFKNSKWYLGIWAVGEWNLKSEYNGEVYDSGYGVDTWKPYSICVFLIHKWNLDKFRPSYANCSFIINNDNIDDEKNWFNDDVQKVIDNVSDIVSNPIKSYYDYIDYDDYSHQHDNKNRYIAYIKGVWNEEIVPYIQSKWRRFCGCVEKNIIYIRAKLDKRVYSVESVFGEDKWNAEYNVAVVFNEQDTPWKSWKCYNDYWSMLKFFRKLTKTYNCELEMTYAYEDDKPEDIEKMKWRGIYWKEEPDKNSVWEEDEDVSDGE